MKLYIKYMVSLRCKMLVKEELKKLGIEYVSVDLGMVEIFGKIDPEQIEKFKKGVQNSGLELMDDKRSVLIEQAKHLIIEMIHYSDEMPEESYADYIRRKLECDYLHLSTVFAEVKGMTIQQFIILNKIEKVKELLIYDELSLTEISYKLQYSSVAHLSNQFKKMTGLAPSFYKKLQRERKLNLSKVGKV